MFEHREQELLDDGLIPPLGLLHSCAKDRLSLPFSLFGGQKTARRGGEEEGVTNCRSAVTLFAVRDIAIPVPRSVDRLGRCRV